MNEAELTSWFQEYLEVYAACGRGESDPAVLLGYYAVPLLLSTDGGYSALTTEGQIVSAVQSQIDGMLASGYHHSDVHGLETRPLNAVTALCRGQFTRRRADDSALNNLDVTYLIASTDAGYRISVLAVHVCPDQ